MDEYLEKLRNNVVKFKLEKLKKYKDDIFDTPAYNSELKYLKSITFDFIHVLRYISIYSTRAGHIYDNFLTIRVIDELLESVIGIFTLVNGGTHNMVIREMRYLVELVTKYVIIDYELMGKKLEYKVKYLKTNIPNSSIEVISRYNPPFDDAISVQFRNEVKDYFYKACSYVHPSISQLTERIENQKKGITIGFETTKMLQNMNKVIFRGYDMILLMIFHGFGHSMGKDIFEQLLIDDIKWKFHQGKYIKHLKVTYRL